MEHQTAKYKGPHLSLLECLTSRLVKKGTDIFSSRTEVFKGENEKVSHQYDHYE